MYEERLISPRPDSGDLSDSLATLRLSDGFSSKVNAFGTSMV